jgi:membrane-associated phospholipid phosphatase
MLLFSAFSAFGQSTDNAQSVAGSPDNPRAQPTSVRSQWLEPGVDPENRLVSPFLKHLVEDQKQFWTKPAHLRVQDLKWVAPLAGITAAFIASDSWWSKQVPMGHVSSSKTYSDYATYSMIGLGGASFLLGHVKHDDRLAEAGLLAGEAAINATAVTYAFKEVTQRQRPYQDDGNGHFFTGGSSFPSEHATIAWSIASVWAHEYPGWFSQAAAYGLASTISITRVTARQHFPSDVLIGSALGWYFARQVYRAHHDPELGGSGWGNFSNKTASDTDRNPNYMASPYVPLDSWIYPELERLIALGYVKSPVLGIRPWTRMTCAHILEEAEGNFPDGGDDQGPPGKIYATLVKEFAPELSRLDGAANVGAQLESVYSRSMQISGTPLRDGYHFGQTIINDYGRPYWTGFNEITGFTADAEAGPVSFYLRGEYQHAPAIPSELPSVLAATAAADNTPPLANGTNQINQFQFLDSMASFNINNVEISVGNQSAWLSPGEGSSFLISNNAPPFPMVKIDDIAPHELPGLSKLLGPFRAQFFIGQLSGQHWEQCALPTCPSTYPGAFVPTDGVEEFVAGPTIATQPFIHGEKISFQPTANLEIGMGVTAMFGGPGLPVTFGNFFRTYYVHTAPANNAGKRLSAADFTYRLPHLRNWVTLYLDSMTWDEVSPIGSTRANVNPGIFMPQIPRIPKLQFRAEGLNISRTKEFPPGWVYYNADRYRSGYINDSDLLGSWIGRAGRGVESWLTYSFSPRNNLQLGYRLQTVAPDFIGGGRLADYSAKGEFMIGHDLSVSGLFQYEQWRFPVLASGPQSDITASVQLTFYPNRIWK